MTCLPVDNTDNEIHCEDAAHTCPEGYWCNLFQNMTCMPEDNEIHCSDAAHTCPEGMWCNLFMDMTCMSDEKAFPAAYRF